MARVSEATISSLQNVDMQTLCSSMMTDAEAAREVPATPHFRIRKRLGAAFAP